MFWKQIFRSHSLYKTHHLHMAFNGASALQPKHNTLKAGKKAGHSTDLKTTDSLYTVNMLMLS